VSSTSATPDEPAFSSALSSGAGAIERTLRYQVGNGKITEALEISQRGSDVAVVLVNGAEQAIIGDEVVKCETSSSPCTAESVTVQNIMSVLNSIRLLLKPFDAQAFGPKYSAVAPSSTEVDVGVESDCRQLPSSDLVLCVSRDFGFLTRSDDGHISQRLVSYTEEVDLALFDRFDAALASSRSPN
jgi:hypothetical protein